MTSRNQIEALWDDIGPLDGWDFSRIRAQRAQTPWAYEDVVAETFLGSGNVMDVGTGGGEKLLAMSDSFGSAVGIDPDPAMVAAAQRNLSGSGAHGISFRNGSADNTEAADESLDGVINRHAVIDVAEVQRILKPGGYFITQQVGEKNLGTLLAPFGGQQFEGGDQPAVVIRRELESSGFKVLRFEEYDVEYRYLDLESVLFQVKAIAGYLASPPTIDSLAVMVEATTDGSGGFVSNEHRYLIKARKPS